MIFISSIVHVFAGSTLSAKEDRANQIDIDQSIDCPMRTRKRSAGVPTRRGKPFKTVG